MITVNFTFRRRLVCLAMLGVFILAACTGSPATAVTQFTPLETAAINIPVPGALATPCALPTVVVPTLPATIPGYTQLDPSTGLHITGQYELIDPTTYRLEVTGKVAHPLSLSYDELRCMPKVEEKCTLICPGNFEDYATWGGVPLSYVLHLAGVEDSAQGINMFGADGYQSTIPIKTALAAENFLAYEWEGQPLPVLHGFPLRAIFPAEQGNKWVKWLLKIEVY